MSERAIGVACVYPIIIAIVVGEVAVVLAMAELGSGLQHNYLQILW